MKTPARVWLALCTCGLAFGQNGALHITRPAPAKDHTIVTTQGAIQLAGKFDWNGSGDKRVLWTNQRGFSDLAIVKEAKNGRTMEWETSGPIPLRPGVNQVLVRALGQPGAAEFVNIYYSVTAPPPPPPQGTALFHGQQITYESIDGFAVYQSDMILGTPEEAKAGKFRGRLATGGIHVRPQSDTIAPNLTYSSGLWPIVNGVVRVPYTITINPGQQGSTQTNINSAIAESNSQLAGVVQWVPATGNDTNLVNFDFTVGNESGTCEAIVGMQGGTQPIGGSEACGVTTILHEMGHALGLYHEQSRADRATWVTYTEGYVDKPQHSNFDIFAAEVDSGLYNYASIMEYGAFSFSRYGVYPVLETIPAGMVLGTEMPAYTTGDIDGIERLYGLFPTKVTVDTNPTGLQIVVDNVTCTAPCSFSNWTLGSQHALAVSQSIQVLSQQPYLFGRWNSDVGNTQSASVTVTNSAGNGTLLSPTGVPAVTAYLASFIPLHPYNPSVAANNGATGSSVGTITPNPAPYTGMINNVSTNYFKDRQEVQLAATPKTGYNFYDWANVPLQSFYQANYAFYITSNFDYLNFNTSQPVEAFFVNDPVTSVIGTSPDLVTGIYPGFTINVVENSNSDQTMTVYTPRNFDKSQDGNGFEPGASVTLCGIPLDGAACPDTTEPQPQSPVTTNMTYQQYAWNGVGTASGTYGFTLTVPASGTTGNVYAAEFTDSFRVIILPSISAQYCAGVSITTNPAPAVNNGTDGGLDAFYPYSTSSTSIMANGDSNATFAGWTGDLGSGVNGSTPTTGNPYAYGLSNQLQATANFNVTGTTALLAVTGVSWTGSPGATNDAVTLTVTGTGFTTSAGTLFAYFGTGGGQFEYRAVTAISSTQFTMQLNQGDLSTVGYNQIIVLNTGGSGCNPQTVFTFSVSDSSGAPALAISKMHNGVFAPGQQNAQYTILVTNTGNAAVTLPVTVTDTLPAGETMVSMAGQNGSGWVCSTASTPYTCTNSGTLAPTTSYGLITVTVNVAGNAASPQVNTATASGGGAEEVTATDSTTIQSTVAVPSVVNDALTTAENDIANAGLTVGTVTPSTSPTVQANNVIGTDPPGGTLVTPGSTVSITYSVGATAALQSIAVSAPTLTIDKGQTDPFTAIGTYNDNSTQNLTTQATWASSNTSAATIVSGAQNGGLATGAGQGSSYITATVGGISSPAEAVSLTVNPAALVSIAVTPTNPSIVVGTSQQFAAKGTYTDGTTPDITSLVTWSSTNTAAATINATGNASGKATGSTTIKAALNSINASTTLSVTGLSACDVNGDGVYSVLDTQMMINEALGKLSPSNDLNGDKIVNVVDIEIATNAVLHQTCVQ